MYTNEQPNDDPSLNRGSANKMNPSPAAGPPGAASQPGEPGAAAPLHAMSTPIQPYGTDTVIYEKSDNFVQTSAGADVFMPPVNDTFSVPEGGATVVASLTVDDWGKLTISGPGGTFELDLTSAADEPGKLGGHQEWSKSGSFELSEGTYTLSITHQNIDMPHNEYNQSVCRYSVTVTAHGDSSSSSSSSDTPPSSLSSSSSSDVPPEEKEICCRCGTCTDAEGNEYTIAAEKLPGDPGVEICMSQAEFLARGGASAPSPAAFSLRSAENARETAEACGGLKYVSPWAWRVHLDETSGLITVVPPVGAALYFNVQAGSDTALPAGISRKRDFRVQLLDETLAPASSGAPAYLSLVDADGQKIRFSAETGAVVGMTSASGRVLLAEDYFRNVSNTYDHEGSLVSSYSAAEGLMRTRTGADGELVMEWYAPAAVTVLADGTYEVTGEPYKTSSYLSSEENGVRTTVITRQQRGLPAHTITRTEEPGRVSIAKGQGDDTIIRTIETNRLYGGLSERIETVRGINDAEPVACNRSVRQYTDGGWLLVSETEAFNTPLARTTSYEYNSQYRVSRINRPDGGYTRYEYDGEGRVTLEAAPWAGGGEQVTRTEYAGLRFYDNRPARVAEFRVLSDGTEIELTAAAYAYEQSPLMERVTKTVTAAGSGQEQTSVEETYGEAAAYPYAAGQIKFTRDIAGVETFYDYEAAAEHGAAHKKTAITKVGGELAAGQSRKTESFLAANDTVLVEQESVWDGDNWLLLSSGAHEYDEEGRRTKTIRGNGRVTSTSWMCCGKLSETDEDGILTSYGYNSAHQLVETIRSEISDGDTVVTPETITTYTRDAAGRVLQTRRDRGAMTTTESVEYDKLGRIVRQTDVLGRVTATAYSENGLTETVTTPAGATLVTERHPDGSVLHEYGTGQRERCHVYDIDHNCLRETVTLAGQTTILSRTLVNGFGQSVLQVTPTTAGFLYDRSEYDEQGHLIRAWRDAGAQEGAVAMAPALYEYDAFGNMTRETLALAEQPAPDNSPIREYAFSVENAEDGIYMVTAQTRYNAEGQPLVSVRKQLLSELSGVLETKAVIIDERGLTSAEWTEYAENTKRIQKSIVPSSSVTAQTVAADGFMLSQQNHAGITETAARAYTAAGMTLTRTDGRGNTVTIRTDLAGRSVSVTDAAGNATVTQYDACHDLAAMVTDALGNTVCARYDARGRKTAEWGTRTQPLLMGYDEADRLVSLTTFRAAQEGDVAEDPTGRADGDVTTWSYDDATGLETRKTYADGTHVDKTWDAFNRLATETNARGIVKTCTYEQARGLLTGISYSDATPGQSFVYDHLGQLTQITDAAGTRTFACNPYGELETDNLRVGNHTHLITEKKDAFGRSTGYIYARSGTAQHTVSISYGEDGRIATAGFLQGSAPQTFTWQYMEGSGLPSVMAMPNGMTLEWGYEEKRDLVTTMVYKRGATRVVEREYAYDSLARPVTRRTARQGNTVNDSFACNSRSELTAATVSGKTYGYSYDNIGNRKTAREDAEEATAYTTGPLNQYTAIERGEEAAFEPVHDADGNQTLIRTSTGIWQVAYNAENRPVRFVNESAKTVVECTYDYMGRRHTRKVSVNGTVSSYLRYMYRGYLQIAAIDAVSGVFRWFLFWDPTQPEAARPLAIRKDGTWYAYGWDLTRNVTEIFGKAGYLRTVYTYTPYGEATAEGDVTQPIQWSSEYNDEELGLVYYNYRHLNPHDGRWISRDPIEEQGGWNLFAYVKNQPIFLKDYVGLISWGAKKIAPDPHPDLPKYKYSIDFWRIGNITLGYPEVYAALIGTRVDSSLAYEMFIKYLSKTGGEYKIDPQYIIDLESGESDGLQDNINLLARLAISYAIEHKCFEKKLYLDSWQLLQTRSSEGNYILGRYYMTMTATVNSDCSVDYTAYISDIYDFDHNSWLQTRFAALEKYGYAAPFNVRGNISGTYRKYKE
ncbi:RHS repeat domain-containing protein [Akkermansia muciniphila]|uniref:RHS repeat domain-containing protein n=9 Tax=cellular organisms TaxID=131567 RepID=UPI00138E6E05|nr:RHS repeat-associated core domain-containing protein [Akkermansia muciniphila]MBT9542678.1 RHS repeat-associated core domain-containing protein [Akkermansia muciniphila]QHV18966.1 sugar-binding protein [Akkermansia muciniphila]QHV30288.1 sugar-binding protein [Akkermansia muciniphila]QHV32661.1 sugar-binding protein [Akkermansia muciniphila]QWP06774.1 RHS repeat-associated core domain-containing protein [Akkermansia muciniphila]